MLLEGVITHLCRPGRIWTFQNPARIRRSSWALGVSGSSTALRVDGPILSEAENAKWVEEQNRKFREPVNLRTATVAELRRIPLVDRYLAEQIHAAVRGGTVTGVDDLLRVKGIDQPRFSVIRPRVRWE
jgi:DNA uptake protein ComE-like DNA-binding protein